MLRVSGVGSPRNTRVNVPSLSHQHISRNPETSLVLVESEQEHSVCLGKTLSLENWESGGSKRKDFFIEEDVCHHQETTEHSNARYSLDNKTLSMPSNRWFKRLRQQQLQQPLVDSCALGTKSSRTDDASAGRRVHKLLTRVLNYSSRSKSDITLQKYLEQDQTGKSILLAGDEESPVELLKKSHSWIRRWCRNNQETANGQTDAEPQLDHRGAEARLLHVAGGQKAARQDDFEGKHFPSLSAMALMGKAASNFRPCEFRRKGPSVVWIT